MLIDEAMLSRAELEVLTAKANSILLQRSSTITKLVGSSVLGWQPWQPTNNQASILSGC